MFRKKKFYHKKKSHIRTKAIMPRSLSTGTAIRLHTQVGFTASGAGQVITSVALSSNLLGSSNDFASAANLFSKMMCNRIRVEISPVQMLQTAAVQTYFALAYDNANNTALASEASGKDYLQNISYAGSGTDVTRFPKVFNCNIKSILPQPLSTTYATTNESYGWLKVWSSPGSFANAANPCMLWDIYFYCLFTDRR